MEQREGCCVRLFPTGYTHELKQLLGLAWPIVSFKYGRSTLFVGIAFLAIQEYSDTVYP